MSESEKLAQLFFDNLIFLFVHKEMKTDATVNLKPNICEDAEDYMIRLCCEFYADNYRPYLTNAQLQGIARKTNMKYGTEYTDDDVFDLFYDFIEEWKEKAKP